MRYSTLTLLTLPLLFAIALALSQFGSLLIAFAFPFTLGPVAAYRVNPSKMAVFIGVVSSMFWTAVSVAPFWIVMNAVVESVTNSEEQLQSQSWFVTSGVTYFFVVSLIGGYVGGVVAIRD